MSDLLYLESSAVLHGLLTRDPEILHFIEAFPHLVTSALTLAEVERVLLRASLEGRLTPQGRQVARDWFREAFALCEVVDVDSVVLGRTGLVFPREPVRTLDAIHLASIQLVEERLGARPRMLTTDHRIRENALELGFAVLPPG